MHHENRHEMVPPILRRGPQPRQRGKARQRGRDPVNGLNANSVDGLPGPLTSQTQLTGLEHRGPSTTIPNEGLITSR